MCVCVRERERESESEREREREMGKRERERETVGARVYNIHLPCALPSSHLTVTRLPPPTKKFEGI